MEFLVREMLIDCFLFHDEIDVLEFRLNILGPLVSHFVIVEADRTFSGNPKPFYLDENYERLRPWHDKILYIRFHVTDDLLSDPSILPPTKYDQSHPCWKIEHAQRNAITGACSGFPSNTLVLLGDVDEIPRREAVEFLVANSPNKKTPTVLMQYIFSFNLRFLRNILWHGTIFIDVKTLREEGAQALRSRKDSIPEGINQSGWHLSWFGGADRIKHKIESFSHAEFNKDEYKNPDRIAHCIETGDCLLSDEGPVTYVAPQAFPDYFREYAPKEWWAA